MEGGEADKAPPKAGAEDTSGAASRRRLRVGVIGLAIVVAVVAWVATRDNGGGSSEPAPAESAPSRIVTEAELKEAAASLGQPIFWAGPMADAELELRELPQGGVQVRYLPEGTEAGAGSPELLTVGSYPLPDPTAAIAAVAKKPGELVRHLSDGRTVVAAKQSPTSVYFASSDNSVQVEVYDPSAQRAMKLALSGKVQPVG